jgi:hypothetical protein
LPIQLPTPTVREPGWKSKPIDKNGCPPTTCNERWYDKHTGRLLQKGVLQAIAYLPTPTTLDGTVGGLFGAKDQLKLTKRGTWRRQIQTGNSCSLGLGRYVKMLPTPLAPNGIYPGVRATKKDQTKHLSAVVQINNELLPPRKLNPVFVSAMMGFPIGWLNALPGYITIQQHYPRSVNDIYQSLFSVTTYQAWMNYIEVNLGMHNFQQGWNKLLPKSGSDQQYKLWKTLDTTTAKQIIINALLKGSSMIALLMTHADLPAWLLYATDTQNLTERKAQLQALGNAVVPHQAAIAWKRIVALAS